MSAPKPNVDALLKPLMIGRKTMANRFVMAPLTRCRADEEHVPTDDMVKYYADRASMGLIISEATQIQKGYSTFGHEGGIYGPEQIAGWAKVTDAVHAKGGLIYCQIHHGGRATVPSNLDKGLKPVAPSSHGISGHKCPATFARNSKKQSYPDPHKLTTEEIATYVQLYVTAAKNAMEAGFDGVQIHGANGYLIDQFLKTSSNKRKDEYGGPIVNRSRFLLEVVDAVIAAVGHEHVALRISPLNAYNDQSDKDPEELTKYICTELNSRRLAFLDVMRGDFFSPARGADEWARSVYQGVMFTGMGFEVEEAAQTIASGAADAVIFGTKAIANPDLVSRAISGAELNTADPNTFYTRGNVGYNDYPMLTRTRRASSMAGVFVHSSAKNSIRKPSEAQLAAAAATAAAAAETEKEKDGAGEVELAQADEEGAEKEAATSPTTEVPVGETPAAEDAVTEPSAEEQEQAAHMEAVAAAMEAETAAAEAVAAAEDAEVNAAESMAVADHEIERAIATDGDPTATQEERDEAVLSAAVEVANASDAAAAADEAEAEAMDAIEAAEVAEGEAITAEEAAARADSAMRAAEEAEATALATAQVAAQAEAISAARTEAAVEAEAAAHAAAQAEVLHKAHDAAEAEAIACAENAAEAQARAESQAQAAAESAAEAQAEAVAAVQASAMANALGEAEADAARDAAVATRAAEEATALAEAEEKAVAEGDTAAAEGEKEGAATTEEVEPAEAEDEVKADATEL